MNLYNNLRGMAEDCFLGLTGVEVEEGCGSGVNPEPTDRRAARRASSRAAACDDRVVRWGVCWGCSNRSRCRARRGPLVTLTRSARLVGGVSSSLSKWKFSASGFSLCSCLAQCLQKLRQVPFVCCLRSKLLWFSCFGGQALEYWCRVYIERAVAI